jgi:hypothetical protein
MTTDVHQYLGAMTWYLDTFFDRREGGIAKSMSIFF